jgi:hypothetical protein
LKVEYEEDAAKLAMLQRLSVFLGKVDNDMKPIKFWKAAVKKDKPP